MKQDETEPPLPVVRELDSADAVHSAVPTPCPSRPAPYPLSVQIRALKPDDVLTLADIDGTIESTQYLHVDQTGEGLSINWRLEPRPLRSKLIEPNVLTDDGSFLVRQIATGADEGLALAAEHDDSVVALLLATPTHESRTYRLADLRVDYDVRREGLATAMLFQLIQHAREQDFRAVLAETATNNFPGTQLLLKCGFDLAGLDTRRRSNHDMVKEAATLIWYASLR